MLMDFIYFIFVLSLLNLLSSSTSTPQDITNGGQSGNPGAEIVLTGKAMEYISATAGNIINEDIRKMSLSDIREPIDKGRVEATSLHLTRFSPAKYFYELIPENRVRWGLRAASLSLNGNWYAEKKIWIKFQADGSFELSVDSILLEVSVRLGKAADGKPTVEETDCSASVNGLHFNFEGGITGFLLNALRSKVGNILKPIIEEKMCDKLRRFVQHDFNGKLRTFNAKRQLKHKFTLDWSLLMHPLVENGRFCTKLKGEIHHNTLGRATPFFPIVLDVVPDDSSMVNMFVSDYVLNSFLFSAWSSKYLEHIIKDKWFLAMACDNHLCLGVMVPSLANAYPNMTATFQFKALDPPAVRINPDKVAGFGKVLFEINMKSSHGALKTVLQTAADVEFSGNASMVGKKLVLDFQIDELNIGKVNCTDNISRDEIADFLTAEFLKPMLTQLAQEHTGMEIFLTEGVSLVNPRVRLGQRTLQIYSDVMYSST